MQSVNRSIGWGVSEYFDEILGANTFRTLSFSMDKTLKSVQANHLGLIDEQCSLFPSPCNGMFRNVLYYEVMALSGNLTLSVNLFQGLHG
jgi:hypothetical protein